MATEKLRVKIEGDASSYKKAINQAKTSTAKLNKAQKTSAKTTNKQGQTFTQLAYALDDAQYGFRGVQNNLQAVAVSAGISGPIVLGITAMLIGIQQLITHWDEFGDIASKAIKAINDEIAGGQGSVASVLLYAETLKNSVEGTKEYEYALKRLVDKGFKPLNTSIEKFIELQKQKAILAAFDKVASDRVATYLGKIVKEQEDYNQAIEDEATARKNAQASTDPEAAGFYSGSITVAKSDQAEAKKNIKEIQAEMKSFISTVSDDIKKYFPNGILNEIINPKTGSGRPKLESVLDFDLIGSTIEQGKEWQKYAKKIVEAFATEWNIAAKGAVLEVPGVDAIDAGLKAVRDKLGHNITKTVEDVKELGQALQASLTQAFIGLGDAIGDAITGEGDFGNKFLQIVGAFMQTLGSAIIGVGVAALALETSLATAQPWLAIGAGVALVAAGAILSNVSKKGVDGKGAGGSQASATTGSTTTPTSINASFGGGLVATVRGQDLVFALEAAQSDRNALN